MVHSAGLAVQDALGQRVSAGDAGRVLVDVVVDKEMPEGRPRDTDAVVVKGHLAPISIGKEISHQIDHTLRAEPLPALHPLVNLQLKSRQRGHNEEVPVEVGHSLLDHTDLERHIVAGLEQIVANNGLVEVRGHLGDEERIVTVEERLGFPREIGVHRVSQLVRQGAQAEKIVIVVHHDERMHALPARRESSGRLTLIGVDINPALRQRPCAKRRHILRPQRRQPSRDPVYRLLEGDASPAGCQWRPDVIGSQLRNAQRLAPRGPIAMPGRQVLAESGDQVVKDLGGDIVPEEGEVQRRLMPSNAHVENVLLDRCAETGRKRIAMGKIGVVIVLICGAARFAISTGQNTLERSLCQLDLGTVGGDRALEDEIRIGQHTVDRRCARESIGHHTQGLLDLSRPYVSLLSEEVINVVT